MDLIIGAGISGLSYANFCGHEDYLIIERSNEIGGYCKTIKKDGFTWDYSGHFFHFRDDKIRKYLLEEMSGQEILEVRKSAQIYYNDRYIDFPFQKNIHQLEKQEFIECLCDLMEREDGDSTSFKNMLYMKYGKSIAEKFLIPYNEKLYACDLDTLDSHAMGRFFPHADTEEIIRNFRESNNESYNSVFTYPRGGAIEYVKSLHRRVIDSKISLNESLVRVDLQNKIAHTDKRQIKYDKLISSIPLPNLLTKANIPWDRNSFTWNKVLVYNLGFNKKGSDIRNHWVYFPEKKYCFYRVGYYDNIFNDDRMSLYVELGFENSEDLDNTDYLPKVLNDLKEAGVIEDHKLLSHARIVMNPAYVHVNESSNSLKDALKCDLEQQGVYSIGRYGDWKYCSIEDNILEAKALAGRLI